VSSVCSDLTKQDRYAQLVIERQACTACASLKLTNPSRCGGGIYDNTGHIGPWTQWQDNLDSELMVVGQDWGGVEYFTDKRGLEQDNNETNTRLIDLLAAIGIQINLPANTLGERRLFFTNAALCLRPGRLTGPVSSRWFSNCGPLFLRPQVELIRPKVVVTLGYYAYRAVCKSFGLKPAQRMRDAIQREPEQLPNGSILVPVYHCGKNGQRSRSLNEQKQDWKRVRVVLEKPKTTI
jgi:uracil-DNA glycosylase family 4